MKKTRKKSRIRKVILMIIIACVTLCINVAPVLAGSSIESHSFNELSKVDENVLFSLSENNKRVTRSVGRETRIEPLINLKAACIMAIIISVVVLSFLNWYLFKMQKHNDGYYNYRF